VSGYHNNVCVLSSLTIIPCEKSRRAILFNKNKRIKYLKGEQGGKIFDIP